MSYLVDFQPLALKALRLEALLPTKALTPAKEKVRIDRDTVSHVFLPRDAMLSAVHAVVVYLSVRLCGCVCHTSVLCKTG